MSNQVHVIVLGVGEYIDSIGAVYADQERVEQAVSVIRERDVWNDTDQWAGYQTYSVNHADPF